MNYGFDMGFVHPVAWRYLDYNYADFETVAELIDNPPA
jgi:hypothetical protein